MPDLRLQQHDLADYRGKVVVLDIIQTSCAHCAVSAETLQKVHQKYGSKVAVLMFANPPDTQATVSTFAADHKITVPILFDCGQAAVSYLKATPDNPSISVPHLFLIDGQGIIRNDFTYGDDTRLIFEGEGLYAEIDQLLGAPAPAKKPVR